MSMHTEEEPPTPSASSAAANIAIARDSSNEDVTTASQIPVGSTGLSLLIKASNSSLQPMTPPQEITVDEARSKPTFVKWLTLGAGKIIRYANNDYMKGGDDEKQMEEKLLKRIIQVTTQNKKS